MCPVSQVAVEVTNECNDGILGSIGRFGIIATCGTVGAVAGQKYGGCDIANVIAAAASAQLAMAAAVADMGVRDSAPAIWRS